MNEKISPKPLTGGGVGVATGSLPPVMVIVKVAELPLIFVDPATNEILKGYVPLVFGAIIGTSNQILLPGATLG